MKSRIIFRKYLAVCGAAICASFALAQTTPDPVIEAARKAAIEFSSSLPDFIVKKTTTRYRGNKASPKAEPDTVRRWQAFDKITVDVGVEHGAEVYSHIVVDGKPAQALPDRGVQTYGEFATLARDILDAEWATVFTKPRTEAIQDRSVWRYDFALDRAPSSWHLAAAITSDPHPTPMNIAPPYRGTIWIDRELARVLRMERRVPELPEDFPLRSVQQAVDYDFVTIADRRYLLPVRTESIICTRGNALCYRNVTAFHDYNRFQADTNIQFNDASN